MLSGRPVNRTPVSGSKKGPQTCVCLWPLQVIFNPSHRSKGQSQILNAPCKVQMRLTEYSASLTNIRLMKSSCIGKLVSLKGTVVRMSSIRPLVQQLDFVCSKCGMTMSCKFPDGKYTPPSSCGTDGCKSRQFSPMRSTAQCVDWQKIRLQVRADLSCPLLSVLVAVKQHH